MSESKHIEQIFPIKCRGRDASGNEVLDDPIEVKVSIHQRFGNGEDISSDVECPYNTGGHGQRCKASHPDADKISSGIYCPYSFDIPHAFEIKK